MLDSVEAVAACDTQPEAVAACRVNVRLNRLEGRVYCTASLPSALSAVGGKADTAIVNPPYLPCTPSRRVEASWCGGARLEAAAQMLGKALAALHGRGLLLTVYSTLSRPNPLTPLAAHRYRLLDTAEARLPWGEKIRAVALEVG
jgi:methylase of polypeptide subunit release factors